jgi:hypothetical protein
VAPGKSPYRLRGATQILWNGKLIAEETEKWGKVIRTANIKL